MATTAANTSEVDVTDAKPNAEYDIFQKMGPFMDTHLLIPILDFLNKIKLYPEEEITEAKLHLLKSTNLHAYAIEIYKQLYTDREVPADLLKKNEELMADVQSHQDDIGEALLDIIDPQEDSHVEQREELKTGQGTFTFSHLKNEFGVTEANIESLYHFAKFSYEGGNYAGGASYLNDFLELSEGDASLNANLDNLDILRFNALWGKLACQILQAQRFDQAFETLTALGKKIDEMPDSQKLQCLQQRSWLLHWGLFACLQNPDDDEGMKNLINICLKEEKNKQALQNNCPWLLRYLVCAVIIEIMQNNMSTKSEEYRALVRAIDQEQYSFSDPMTQFIKALSIDFDFEEAIEKLKVCEEVLVSDFFLANHRKKFMESARLLVFETYCKTHQKIDFKQLSDKLGMSHDGERWVVELIRKSHLKGAKINSEENWVEMKAHYPSVYQQIVEKMTEKQVVGRTHELFRNLDIGRGGGQYSQKY
jgi:translation initiation factor 3 subunit E